MVDDQFALAASFLIAGYIDDVMIQIAGDEVTSELTIRSKSRIGNFDLFVNYFRVWGILKKIDRFATP